MASLNQFANQTISSFTAPGNGVLDIRLANGEGYQVLLKELGDILHRTRRQIIKQLLLWEIAKIINTAGVDPDTATFAQVQTAVVGQTVPW